MKTLILFTAIAAVFGAPTSNWKETPADTSQLENFNLKSAGTTFYSSGPVITHFESSPKIRWTETSHGSVIQGHPISATYHASSGQEGVSGQAFYGTLKTSGAQRGAFIHQAGSGLNIHGGSAAHFASPATSFVSAPAAVTALKSTGAQSGAFIIHQAGSGLNIHGGSAAHFASPATSFVSAPAAVIALKTTGAQSGAFAHQAGSGFQLQGGSAAHFASPVSASFIQTAPATVAIEHTEVKVPIHKEIHLGLQNYVSGLETRVVKPEISAAAIFPPAPYSVPKVEVTQSFISQNENIGTLQVAPVATKTVVESAASISDQKFNLVQSAPVATLHHGAIGYSAASFSAPVAFEHTEVKVPIHKEVQYGVQNFVSGYETKVAKPEITAQAIFPPAPYYNKKETYVHATPSIAAQQVNHGAGARGEAVVKSAIHKQAIVHSAPAAVVDNNVHRETFVHIAPAVAFQHANTFHRAAVKAAIQKETIVHSAPAAAVDNNVHRETFVHVAPAVAVQYSNTFGGAAVKAAIQKETVVHSAPAAVVDNNVHRETFVHVAPAVAIQHSNTFGGVVVKAAVQKERVVHSAPAAVVDNNVHRETFVHIAPEVVVQQSGTFGGAVIKSDVQKQAIVHSAPAAVVNNNIHRETFVHVAPGGSVHQTAFGGAVIESAVRHEAAIVHSAPAANVDNNVHQETFIHVAPAAAVKEETTFYTAPAAVSDKNVHHETFIHSAPAFAGQQTSYSGYFDNSYSPKETFIHSSPAAVVDNTAHYNTFVHTAPANVAFVRHEAVVPASVGHNSVFGGALLEASVKKEGIVHSAPAATVHSSSVQGTFIHSAPANVAFVRHEHATPASVIQKTEIEVPIHKEIQYGVQDFVSGYETKISKPQLFGSTGAIHSGVNTVFLTHQVPVSHAAVAVPLLHSANLQQNFAETKRAGFTQSQAHGASFGATGGSFGATGGAFGATRGSFGATGGAFGATGGTFGVHHIQPVFSQYSVSQAVPINKNFEGTVASDSAVGFHGTGFHHFGAFPALSQGNVAVHHVVQPVGFVESHLKNFLLPNGKKSSKNES